MTAFRCISATKAARYTSRKVYYLDRHGNYLQVKRLRPVGPNVEITLTDGRCWIAARSTDFFAHGAPS